MEKINVIFLLDRSGSMNGSESDTIGGYNSFLKKQKDNTLVTTILFDDKYETLYYREDIKKVKKLTSKEYYVRGCTALYDAIGITVNRLKKDVKNQKVLFVITTDGLENASKEYHKDDIKKIIEENSNFEFIYLGANIDSYAEGSKIGIKSSNISNYKKTRKGISDMFGCVSKACEAVCNDCFDESWKEGIE
jgi:uncharacterized protein with von Willebrand factor type A (vWA) domain